MDFDYGEDKWIMKEGDCLSFDANIPHVGIRIDDRPLKLFMVSSPDSDGNLLGKVAKEGIAG